MAGGMKVSFDGLRKNMVRSVSHLGRLIDGNKENVPDWSWDEMRDAYNEIRSYAWTLASIYGDIDEPIEDLNMTVYTLTEDEEPE